MAMLDVTATVERIDHLGNVLVRQAQLLRRAGLIDAQELAALVGHVNCAFDIASKAEARQQI